MNADVEHTNELASINQKIASEGEVLPTVQLKDGSRAQTGTVATMLLNVELYNKGQRGEIERELELAVPTLVKVGLFDLFTPQEWSSATNPGRSFVGELAKRYLASRRTTAETETMCGESYRTD